MKYIWPAIGILAAAFLGFCVWQYTQSGDIENETALSESYETENYSVRYYEGVRLQESEAGQSLYYWGSTQVEGTEIYDGFLVAFESFEGQTVEEVVDAQIENIEDIGSVVSQPQAVQIDGRSGTYMRLQGLGEFDVYTVASGEGALRISVLVADPENLGYEAMVEEILSSIEIK